MEEPMPSTREAGETPATREAGETPAALLSLLARQFPTVDAALAQIARLSAELTLPKGSIHVISDVHGEDVKLRHVINNASGTLRPLVEEMFSGQLSGPDLEQLLRLLFYPRQTLDRVAPSLDGPEARRSFSQAMLARLFELIRALSRRTTVQHASQVFPDDYRDLLQALLYNPGGDRAARFQAAVIDSLVRSDRDLHLIHLAVRVARNLAIEELIIAGDCFDRGPRADRVVEYLMRQPSVSFTWGNHDAAWIGACLGQEALIAHVIRVSARYRRLSQIEEGYGITLQPIEHLVRNVYCDDPATHWVPSGTGLREPITMARIQKAAAVLQFKLEGQTIARNPGWDMEPRRLMHRIDLAAATITLDGTTHPLKDRAFPTLDPADPYALSAEEQTCMARLRKSFLASQKLWEHAQFLVSHGGMYLVRDRHLIFHGCVPVDEDGRFQELPIDGRPCAGRALFEAINRAVVRSLDDRRTQADADLHWYLWCGPRSPLFGKDRITTLERVLVADKATHEEHKNPYFRLIHEPEFCERILSEFGVDPERGLIVNGHVPVKLEKGESPMKRSGKAITIDGAFSPAYGDHGFTLVLEPDRTTLAKHHHFESVEAAVTDGVDIIPEVSVVREWSPPRRVADTEQGARIREQIRLLEGLVDAYRSNAVRRPD
jgi:fructose-1,6-bisphosphatase-3